jgi:hypothetical protein
MNILQLKKDMILFSIFLVIANVIQSRILKTELFDDVWKLIMIGTYIGLIVYNLVIYRISNYIIQKINKPECNAGIIDSVQYLTIIFFQYIVYSIAHGEMIDFDNEWFVTIIITFICFVFFILVPVHIPSMDNVNNMELLLNLMKLGISVLIYCYVISRYSDSELYDDPFILAIPLLIGYSIYHLFDKNNYLDKFLN